MAVTSAVRTARALDTEAYDHAARESRARRRGAALCLSGGGFRATLFHLGALRRLNELGVLGHLDAISSVSGGSIASAFLVEHARPWPEPGEVFPEWDRRVGRAVRAFCGRDQRTAPIARSLLPWNLPRADTAVRALAAGYEGGITRRRLADLPVRPAFVFCATNMVFGNNWEFRRARVGDYLTGYCPPPPDWTIGRAVAASSCFPPVFRPLPVGLPPGQLRRGRYQGADRDTLVAHASLTDGGVYDNMGLEPVWTRSALTLVSDGGGLFPRESRWNILLQLLRYNSIIHNQAGAMRKRWLIASYRRGVMDGAYWGIGSAASSYDVGGGYTKALAAEAIAPIRTDLDAFSPAEAAVLENHGYVLADAAIRRHVAPAAPQYVAHPDAPLAVPHPEWHPEWMDERRIRRALAESHRRMLLGRR